MKHLIILLTLLALMGCASTPKSPVVPATKVDLPRFMGEWRVIANIPYFAEKDCYNSTETYRLTPDGKVDTVFTARKGGFDGKPLVARNTATVTDPGVNARWTAAFVGGLVKVDLVILAVSDDYQYAVMATPDGKLAWIFSRHPTLSETDYSRAVAVLKANKIDTQLLAKVPQQVTRH